MGVQNYFNYLKKNAITLQLSFYRPRLTFRLTKYLTTNNTMPNLIWEFYEVVGSHANSRVVFAEFKFAASSRVASSEFNL